MAGCPFLDSAVHARIRLHDGDPMTTTTETSARVLIVDDEATIRQFMIEVLSRFDFTPIPASDAAEALQILDGR